MYTPIQLDKIRNLRYGMVAISKMESALKMKMSKLDLSDLSMTEMAIILWAGLVHEDAKLTPEKVMELVDEHSTITEAMEMMSKAFEASFSQSTGKKTEPRTN